MVLVVTSWAVAFAGRHDEPLSKRAYEEKVWSAYPEVQSAFRQTQGASGTELADRVERAQDTLREAADELEGVKPPVFVAPEHRQLVEGMREYADDLDELRVAIEAGDSAAVERFTAGIPRNRAIQKIAEAAEEMRNEGYDLGPIAEE